MALSALQRRTFVDEIVSRDENANEDFLNNLTDNQLVSLHQPDRLDEIVDFVANAQAEDDEEEDEDDFEDDEDVTGNMEDADDEEPPAKKDKKGPQVKTLAEYSVEELMAEIDGRKPPKKGKKMTGNSGAPKQLTEDEFFEMAPDSYKRLITNAQAAEEQKREEFITIISTNEGNQFTEEQLRNSSLENLEAVASIARVGSKIGVRRVTGNSDYSGLGGGTLVGNAGGEEPLGLPDVWGSED